MAVLMHHGVKNQQWGVRRGPPYPIKPGAPIHIKKGTHIKRISPRDESTATGHAYANIYKEDSDRFTGFFAKENGGARKIHKKTQYQLDLEVQVDLNGPTAKQRIETFKQLISDDKRFGKELTKYDDSQFSKSDLRKFRKQKLDEVTLLRDGYQTFVAAIGGNEYLRNSYFNALRSQGFNMVTDDLDSGLFARSAFIVFDRETNLKQVDIKELKPKEINDAFKKYTRYIDRSEQFRTWEEYLEGKYK